MAADPFAQNVTIKSAVTKTKEELLLDGLKKIISKEDRGSPYVSIDDEDVSSQCESVSVSVLSNRHMVFSSHGVVLKLDFHLGFIPQLRPDGVHKIEVRPMGKVWSPTYSYNAICVKSSVDFGIGGGRSSLEFHSVGPVTTTTCDPGKEFMVVVG